jgi:hypothetical protein
VTGRLGSIRFDPIRLDPIRSDYRLFSASGTNRPAIQPISAVTAAGTSITTRETPNEVTRPLGPPSTDANGLNVTIGTPRVGDHGLSLPWVGVCGRIRQSGFVPSSTVGLGGSWGTAYTVGHKQFNGESRSEPRDASNTLICPSRVHELVTDSVSTEMEPDVEQFECLSERLVCQW